MCFFQLRHSYTHARCDYFTEKDGDEILQQLAEMQRQLSMSQSEFATKYVV